MTTEFLEPGRLWWLLVVIGLAVVYVLVLQWRRRATVKFTQVDLLDRVAPSRPRWRRHVVAGLQLLGLAAAVVAMARPVERTTERTNAEGRTEVIFLHKISDGPADRSFGIHVAELAGLPEDCLTRAQEILHGLENEARTAPSPSSSPKKASTNNPQQDLPLFEDNPIMRDLRMMDADKLTPIEALQKISEWKKIL